MRSAGILLCFIVPLLLQAQKKPRAYISSVYLKKHIEYLASDKLKGRGTGTQEELTAANYIAQNFKKLKLQPKGNINSYYYSFSFRKRSGVHDTVGTGEVTQGINVAAFLDNYAEHTIVIGAHFDHLGLGHDHNSREPDPAGKIHNGADDNASGVAGVLELAKYFKSNNIREKYNFLFMCFSGEELGLVGSKKFCEKPTIDLSKVNYMINLDMIGRLNDTTKKLMVYGVGTAPEFVPYLDSLKNELHIVKDSSGIGPSDQTSFYLKDIPVLHYFTGQHADYHKPSDDVDKINYEGEVMVLDYVIRLIVKLDNKPKLKFQKTRYVPETRTIKAKVSMGIMPDYAFEGKGLRADGVTDGKPAQKAGLMAGDVIIQLGDKIIHNIQDYMAALGTFNKGDKTIVVINRGGNELKFEVNF